MWIYKKKMLRNNFQKLRQLQCIKARTLFHRILQDLCTFNLKYLVRTRKKRSKNNNIYTCILDINKTKYNLSFLPRICNLYKQIMTMNVLMSVILVFSTQNNFTIAFKHLKVSWQILRGICFQSFKRKSMSKIR